MQEHSFHQERSDMGGGPDSRKDNESGQATLGEPIRTEQMETLPADWKDKTIQSFAENILRLGNECRALAEENARLKAEVERLKAEKDQAECDYDNCQRRKVSIDNHRCDLFMENKTLKAKVERLRKADGWQPIETAPFDPNIRIIICTFDDEVEITYSSDLCHYPEKEYPKYWMPVPKPHKEGKPSV
jgi:hypothetical protein